MTEIPQPRVALNLFVSDMRATAAFYKRLGVEVPVDAAWGEHHAQAIRTPDFELTFDSVALTKGYDTGWKDTGDARWGVITFGVSTRDKVDALYQDLVGAGYAGRQPPFDAFWGARYAIVDDPNGNGVGLMSPRDPARGSQPPSL